MAEIIGWMGACLDCGNLWFLEGKEDFISCVDCGSVVVEVKAVRDEFPHLKG